MKEKPKKKKLDQGKRMFLYMLPFLLLCFAFSYFPLHGWIYSFYDYKPPLKLSQCNFMGLRWFKMIFGNPAQVRQLYCNAEYLCHELFKHCNIGSAAVLCSVFK